MRTVRQEEAMIVDSGSRGEPARFRALAELETELKALPAAPTERGYVALVVSRRERGRRETPDRVRLTPEGGVSGDSWGRQKTRQVDEQIAVMQFDVARLIANGQTLTLSGDNLFLDLDLSAGKLPHGSRVRVGSALVEVTAKPHNGCRKFRGRFGDGALRLVSKAELRHRNLRGIYMHVLEEGDAGPGDPVEVVSRGGSA